MIKIELPDRVEEKINEMQREFQIDKERITKKYREIYKSDFVQEDEQFETERDRQNYSLRLTWVHLAPRQPPAQEWAIIPFGFTQARTTRSGARQSRIYALGRKKGDEKASPKVLICQDDLSEAYKDIELFNAYRIGAGGSDSALFPETDTKFEEPKLINIDPIKFLKEEIKAKQITIEETPKKKSKTTRRGYADEFDLRMIRGIVIRHNKGKSGGREWGVYSISDDTVSKQRTLSDGTVVPSQLTVWTPPSQIKYGKDSDAMFVGTVTIGRNNEPQMNAITVVPLHTKPIGR